jgi:hypothetical protein
MAEDNNRAKLYRHGDVQLTRVSRIPSDVTSLGERKEIAYGEVTGHAHRIDVGELFQSNDGFLYLKVDSLARLSHEEHATKTIEPGLYRIAIKRQYDPGKFQSWREVKD